MSFLSDKTGRPKEQGGHRRINISVDERTSIILRIPENRSQFIETTIGTCIDTEWVSFYEPKETVSYDHKTYETAAVFVWTPDNTSSNAILSTYCCFKHRCTGETIKFRMTINDKSSDDVEEASNNGYTQSYTYNINFDTEVFTNQGNYVIELQFMPQHSSEIVHIKDVKTIIEVIDGLHCCD